MATLLTSAIGGVQSSLSLLGTTYAGRGTAGVAYDAAAKSLVSGGVVGVGVADVVGSDLVVQAAEGSVPPAGSVLTLAHADVARRALEAKGLVSVLSKDATTGRTLFILAFGRDDGTVVYEDSIVDPSNPAPRTPGSPYEEIDLALYRSPTKSADQLVLTTAKHQSFPGTVDRRKLTIGAEQWLMITAAREPLGGTLARSASWIILGIGIVASLLAALAVEVVTRRRRYAMLLVDDRTDELQRTVAELEAAARLRSRRTARRATSSRG